MELKFHAHKLSVLDRGKGSWQYSQSERWLGRPKGSCGCEGIEKSCSSWWHHNPGCQSLIAGIIDCQLPAAVWGPKCSTCRAGSPLPVVLSNIPRTNTRSSSVAVSTSRHFSKRVRVFHSVVPWNENETDKSAAYFTKAKPLQSQLRPINKTTYNTEHILISSSCIPLIVFHTTSRIRHLLKLLCVIHVSSIWLCGYVCCLTTEIQRQAPSKFFTHPTGETYKPFLTSQLPDATITICWSPRSAQHVSGNLSPIFRSVRLRFTACGTVSWCCGRLGFEERQSGTATLPLSEPQPTTTTGHCTTCCKSQSYAPEDGRKIAQNMLSDLGDQ